MILTANLVLQNVLDGDEVEPSLAIAALNCLTRAALRGEAASPTRERGA